MTTTTPTSTEVANILERAADHIDRVGWVQGDWWEEQGGKPAADCRVCAEGAIFAAIHGTPEAGPEVVRAQLRLQVRAAMALKATTGLGIIKWNDTEGRTQAEVTATLRETAAGLREQVTA